MPSPLSLRRALHRLIPFVVLLIPGLGACTAERTEPLGGGTAGLELTLVMGRLDAAPGDTVVLAVVTRNARERRLGVLEGALGFDPTRLEYVGQIPDPAARVDLVNSIEAGRGRLSLLSYHVGGLGDTTTILGFRVLGADYVRGLVWHHALAATTVLLPLPTPRQTGVEAGPVPLASGLAIMDLEDWNRMLGPGARAGSHIPGQYVSNLRYGDATLDGSLNVLDAAWVANAAVGNNQIILGTDVPARDGVVAANVHPFNLPGLGEGSDSLPPGAGSANTRELNGLDVLAIANEATGTDFPIVGELIPGRGAAPGTRTPVSGVLTGSVVWSPATVYSLQGTVTVPSGGTLTITPGTLIEAAVPEAGIVVQAGGRLMADGTALEPVTFRCVSFGGCGSALSWTGNAAANPTEDAGYLKYVRVDGFSVGMWLTQLGSGTLLDYVQVAGRAGQPISAALALNGGAMGIRHLVLGPEIAGPAISITGWSGRGQFLLMRPRVVAGGWLFHAILPSATPPLLYNVTAAAAPGSAVAGFPRFSAGANGIVRNLLLYQTGLPLNVEDAATCGEIAAGRLRIENSLFLDLSSHGNPDVDASPCAGFFSPNVEQGLLEDATAANRFLDGPAGGELVGGDDPLLWDLRPRAGSLASTGAATPPADGFFDPTATYVGAVAPAGGAALPGNIPWYAGWILHHSSGAPVPAPSGVQGTLTSSAGGPLEGVTVSVSGGYGGGTSDSNGDYAVGGWPAGQVTLTFGTLPAGCTPPPPQLVTTVAGVVATLNLTFTCAPLAGSVQGTITSPELGPLTGTVATLSPSGGSATASATGAYTIGGVSPGIVDVTLSNLPDVCPVPAPLSVTIVSGQTTAADFSLSCPPTITPTALTLTYMCTNTFRVRNPNYAAVVVTWDVAGTAESGALTLPARIPGSSYSETYFGTAATGTVRLFVDGTQVQVKANGGFACAPGSPGTVLGRVTSTLLGPLQDVRVAGGGNTATTDAAGAFVLAGAASGTVSLSFSNLPLGCAAPGAVPVGLPGGTSVQIEQMVTCAAPAGAFIVDVDVNALTATNSRVPKGPGVTSLLGSDAVQLTIANVFASPVGSYSPGKVRVWFDLQLTGLLNGVTLVTPTWPVPPPGQVGVFLFPFSAVAFTTSGGVISLIPNTGQVVASPDWNGDGAPDQPVAPALPGAGGDPWNWFNDPNCGSPQPSGSSDCYRYETLPALPPLGTSAPRRVGFDIDPSVGNFRAYLVVAADVS